MNNITINRTPAQIYSELRRFGKYEFKTENNTLIYSFDFGGFVKHYEVFFAQGVAVQVREINAEVYSYTELFKKLQFGNF